MKFFCPWQVDKCFFFFFFFFYFIRLIFIVILFKFFNYDL